MQYRHLTENEYADLAARILYEDNHLLVFDKNVGEIVQGDKTGDEPLSETLKAFIAQRDGKPGQVFLGVPFSPKRPRRWSGSRAFSGTAASTRLTGPCAVRPPRKKRVSSKTGSSATKR